MYWQKKSMATLGYAQYCSLCLDWIVGCRSGDAGLAAMAGVAAGLPAGVRLSDHISLGVIARAGTARTGAPGSGGNRQGERARARFAGAGDGLLRHRPGA